MAEQFLSRLSGIEKSIEELNDMLKRMVTILSTVTEIKSEIRIAKVETLEAIKAKSSGGSEAKATEELVSLMVSELQSIKDQIVTSLGDVSQSGASREVTRASQDTQAQIEALGTSLRQMLEEFKYEILEAVTSSPSVQAPMPPAIETPAPTHVYETPAASVRASSAVPPDKGMKVAEQLEKVVQSLKMGCLAGDVLDVMLAAKTEIMKFLPSDQIMVKLDKWAGVVSAYSKRHQLQAKDIMKLKKEIKDEIPRYAPA
ncbi:MAG: hypothetical protein HXY34_03360 [Candidatus Thorarchaeota archaeon]|nr:hypothetical protein [Candidatus Thorarchaeota archaeon]